MNRLGWFRQPAADGGRPATVEKRATRTHERKPRLSQTALGNDAVPPKLARIPAGSLLPVGNNRSSTWPTFLLVTALAGGKSIVRRRVYLVCSLPLLLSLHFDRGGFMSGREWFVGGRFAAMLRCVIEFC